MNILEVRSKILEELKRRGIAGNVTIGTRNTEQVLIVTVDKPLHSPLQVQSSVRIIVEVHTPRKPHSGW